MTPPKSNAPATPNNRQDAIGSDSLARAVSKGFLEECARFPNDKSEDGDAHNKTSYTA